ncbi:MAG: acyl-CoA dehydrogenase family protein [Gemmatimonadota bacterium]
MTAARPFGTSFLVEETHADDVVTPEDLGDEERMLMEAFEHFAEREVGPHLAALERGDREVGQQLFRKAAELGVFMAEVPEEDGGLDLSVLAVAGMCSIRSRLGALGSLVFAHQGIGMLPLVNFATPEQRDRYLVPAMNGDILSAFALTEPGTGSDAMNIETRAVLDAGTHYVLNGAKQWITNAGVADIFIVFAKIDGDRFTAFIMERDTPGLTVGANERLLGQHGVSVAALSLEDVRIPVENVLGDIGRGHKVAFCTLNMGRLKLSTYAAGGARGALEAAAKYAAERHQFGRPIGDFGMIQRKLADMAARAYAAESVAYRASGLVYRALETAKGGARPSLDEKLATLSEFSAECAMAKVFASEAYNHLADEALQVFGGYGYSEEYPPAHMYRDSRITRIYEGTNEICRLYAQRVVLKRAWGGELPIDGALATEQAGRPSLGGADTHAAVVHGLKRAYLQLVRAVGSTIDHERMFEPENQQLVASLADVAIEIFAAESAALRVAKSLARGTEHADLLGAVARLCLARAADRARLEAGEILAAISAPEALASRLAEVTSSIPLPPGLIEDRASVARVVLELGGLPAREAQPVR